MSYAVIRACEGDPLPTSAVVQRILATEEVPVGTGTATRRRLTLLVTDGRFWLSDEEKRRQPLGASDEGKAKA